MINGTLAHITDIHLTQQFAEIVLQVSILKYFAASFGALLGGVLADWIGRRMTLGIGLTLYGIDATFSGLVSASGFFIFTAVTTGLSWGIFLVYISL